MALKTFASELGGQQFIIEHGLFAGQAHGAVTVRLGDTVVLVTAVMSEKPREGGDFFPLLIDYDEKLYAAGKIKSSRFMKREGRASDDAILTARMVDRSIRPLFDERIRNDVQVVITVLSFDQTNDPDLLAIVGASLALGVSSIPWAGPVGAVRVGRINGEFVLNPTYEARSKSDFEILISGSEEKILMIEAGAKQVPEEDIFSAVEFGMSHMKKQIGFLKSCIQELAVPKAVLVKELSAEEQENLMKLTSRVHGFLQDKLTDVLVTAAKEDRNKKMAELREALDGFLKADNEVGKDDRATGVAMLEDEFAQFTKRLVLTQGKRIDGRNTDEVRPLSSQVGLLPRTHGSAFFSRGETQSLSIVTLGSPSEEQTIDSMEESTKKRYMHHYNFPGFSTGEVAPVRGPGRREIGHGALGEKALLPVLPNKETFPYTIRVVSEILSANASTSMAATCGSSLALMDAGVPITDAIGGISMGLVTERNERDEILKYLILSDMQGVEDFWGEMDFKVAGSRKGITAIQLDVKNDGLTLPLIRETLDRARTARMKVLDAMDSAIAAPRAELSPHAPRIYTLQIPVDKIRDVIGPGGKMINEIIAATGVLIDIEDSGLVMVTSVNAENANKAIEWIKNLTREAEVGELYTGKVTRILDFGAFVEILPKQDGMIHISELAPFRVDRVEDIVHLGDVLTVKVIGIDDMGRINLSLKQTDFDYSRFQHLAERSRFSPRNHNGDNHARDRRRF